MKTEFCGKKLVLCNLFNGFTVPAPSALNLLFILYVTGLYDVIEGCEVAREIRC
jgi:hypothetical protein